MQLVSFFQTYTYLLWVCFLTIPWIFIFFNKETNKREMLSIGTLFGILAVMIGKRYSLLDYWHPNYILFPLEDFLYAFLFSGIITEWYKFFFSFSKNKPGQKHYIFAWMSLFITVISFILITDILGFNSFFSYIMAPILIGIFIAIKKPQIFKIQVLSALFATILTFIIFQILLLVNPDFVMTTWKIEKLSGILFLSIPIEEYIFAFSLGFGLSLFYKFISGRELE